MSKEKDSWEFERENIADGWHSAFVYAPNNIETSEIGDVFLGIEDGVLWRIQPH